MRFIAWREVEVREGVCRNLYPCPDCGGWLLAGHRKSNAP